jgi:hypothetical protein
MSFISQSINTSMRFNEFAPKLPKPPTPEQGRVNALQANKDRAANTLAAERQRQKVAKAQESLRAATSPAQPMNMPKPTAI